MSSKKCIVTINITWQRDDIAVLTTDKGLMRLIPFPYETIRNPEMCPYLLDAIFSKIIPCNEIEAILFLFIYCPEFSIEQLQNVKEELRTKCRKHGILFLSPASDYPLLIDALTTAKPDLKNEEYLAYIVCMISKEHRVVVRILKKTDNEFRYIECYRISNLSRIKRDVMKKYDIKQIILITPIEDKQSTKDAKTVQDMFRNCKIFSLVKEMSDTHRDASKILVDHFMNNKVPKYNLRYFGDQGIEAAGLIKYEKLGVLPFEKSVIFDVKHTKYITFRDTDNHPRRISLEKFKLQKVKITLIIDINQFYDIAIEVVVPPISLPPPPPKMLPKHVSEAENSSSKAKIIFMKNSFQMCVMKKDKTEIIKDPDELLIFPLYISFVDEKPVIGNSAMKDLKECPTFVIYDLIKLCSENIMENIDLKWAFKVLKNYDEEILIEFDTFRGRRKTSPIYLLSMVLGFCSKSIKDHCDEKLNEIGIKFKDVEGKEMLKDRFIKAAEKANLKIFFI